MTLRFFRDPGQSMVQQLTNDGKDPEIATPPRPNCGEFNDMKPGTGGKSYVAAWKILGKSPNSMEVSRCF